MHDKRNHLGRCALVVLIATSVAACATSHGSRSGSAIITSGPMVREARVSPDAVDLDRELHSDQPVEIFAEIDDFQAEIRQVEVRFIEVPVLARMERINGSTWRAELSREVLAQLALGNQTSIYQARIYAHDTNGNFGVTDEPLKIAVRAPSFDRS